MDELQSIAERYKRRGSAPDPRYSFSRTDVFEGSVRLDRRLRSMLVGRGWQDFANLRVLEVGCGAGGNLLRLLRWGFMPENLVGNELLPARAAAARRVLPAATQILTGDARHLSTDQPFDLVLQFTVLSSILDDQFQADLASTMWALTAPGGSVVSYDFAYDNPRNPDVRAVKLDRLRQLFPDADLEARRVTLAPPIARRVGTSRAGYAVLHAVPLLRTHVLAMAGKPAHPS